jgi:hypothetical protein
MGMTEAGQETLAKGQHVSATAPKFFIVPNGKLGEQHIGQRWPENNTARVRSTPKEDRSSCKAVPLPNFLSTSFLPPAPKPCIPTRDSPCSVAITCWWVDTGSPSSARLLGAQGRVCQSSLN